MKIKSESRSGRCVELLNKALSEKQEGLKQLGKCELSEDANSIFIWPFRGTETNSASPTVYHRLPQTRIETVT